LGALHGCQDAPAADCAFRSEQPAHDVSWSNNYGIRLAAGELWMILTNDENVVRGNAIKIAR